MLQPRAPEAPTQTRGSPRNTYLLGFVLLGVTLSFVGPSMSYVRGEVGASLSQGGLLAASQYFGYIVTSVFVAKRFDKGHGHPTMVVAMALVSVAVVLIDGATLVWVAHCGFALVGAGAATIDVGSNTLMAWSQPPQRVATSLNLLHLCFGIGAIATPLIVARSIDHTGGLAAVAAITTLGAVAMALAFMRTDQPKPRELPLGPRSVDHGYKRAVLYGVAAFFFVFAGAEATMAVWITTWGEDLGLGDLGSPALLTAVFWIGFTLGRLTAVLATRRHRPIPILLISCCVGSGTAGLLFLAQGSEITTWICVAVLGGALGPQYATMYGAVDHFIGLDGRTTGRIVAAAGLGSLAVPAFSGFVLERHGTELLPAIVTVGLILSTAGVLLVRSSGSRSSGRFTS